MIPHAKDAMMRQHIQSWQSSRMSQREYCSQHNLRPYIFSYYKKKLNKSINKLPSVSNQLIPIDILAQTPKVDTIQLCHSNGFHLEINPEHDMSYLKPLLELVRSVV